MLTGPPVVHCSAGLGRTGVYIAVTVLAAHIREKGREADIDIAKLVSALRDQREGMVQTPDQYRLLYSAVMVCAGLSESLLPGGEGKFRVPYTTVSFQPAGPSAAATFQPVEPARVS